MFPQLFFSRLQYYELCIDICLIISYYNHQFRFPASFKQFRDVPGIRLINFLYFKTRKRPKNKEKSLRQCFCLFVLFVSSGAVSLWVLETSAGEASLIIKKNTPTKHLHSRVQRWRTYTDDSAFQSARIKIISIVNSYKKTRFHVIRMNIKCTLCILLPWLYLYLGSVDEPRSLDSGPRACWTSEL